jgi:Insertion element 4 transposase N-terminal/Transposase DDE domain
VAQNAGVAAAGRLTDWISIGVLASSVPRDAVDEAVAVCGKQARRSDGKLPPHVMVYFAMALALFADDDYEEVLTRLAEPLMRWGCWDADWQMPGSGGITQARQRLGYEPVKHVFEAVAQPVCETLTRGAWLAGRRVVSIDGFEWDAADSKANAAFFGYAGGSANPSAFPKVRVVTLVESGSHAPIGAQLGPTGGKGSGEQSLARDLYPLLEADMLLVADRNFYSFTDWCAAAEGGADLLWRLGEGIDLPLVRMLGEGSYLSLVFAARIRRPERERILAAARAGQHIDEDKARLVRVLEYQIPDRGHDTDRELICLLTTILDPHDASAEILAQGYHDRWDHETANDQLKTHLRGPGRVLRSHSPDMVRQEIYGYLLTHYAISALITRAATEADIDPDRVKFLRTVRIVRRRIDDPAAFSP